MTETSEPTSVGAQRAQLRNGTNVPSQERFERLLARFGTVRVQFDCALGVTQMKLRNVLALKIGSIVMLDRPVGEDLEVSINGVPVGGADVAIADSSVRVRITKLDT
jgi:flagellar motor switch/type III secretory pathway protein FliN